MNNAIVGQEVSLFHLGIAVEIDIAVTHCHYNGYSDAQQREDGTGIYVDGRQINRQDMVLSVWTKSSLPASDVK